MPSRNSCTPTVYNTSFNPSAYRYSYTKVVSFRKDQLPVVIMKIYPSCAKGWEKNQYQGFVAKEGDCAYGNSEENKC